MPLSVHRLAWLIRTDIRELWTSAGVGAFGKNSTGRALERIDRSLNIRGQPIMTIELPKTTFADKLLALIGKKRAVRFPFEVYEKFGEYVYAVAQKESFCRALFRPKSHAPPEGWVYPDQIYPGEGEDGK